MYVYRRRFTTVVAEDFPLYWNNTVCSSQEAIRFLQEMYKANQDDLNCYECFYVLGFNVTTVPVAYCKISQGSSNQTCVDIKAIARFAIDCNAGAVILVHNHPSGKLHPSQADHSLTRKVKEALNLFDIVVNDHIILSSAGHYSFADEGML